MNLDEIEQAEQEELALERKAKKKKSFFRREKKEKPDLLPDDIYKKTDLKGFFIRFKHNFSKLLSVNILMVLGNFPFIFGILALSGLTKNPFVNPSSELFFILRGATVASPAVTPSGALSYGLGGILVESSAMTPLTYVLIGLCCLMFFTFGIVNVGTTYLIRNMIKGEHVFLWSDFWYAVKRNFKQAFFFGILDLLLLVLIPYNIVYLYFNASNIFITIMFYLTIIFSLIYIVMRFYIYLLMITFDLKIIKILKNSLIFVVLGIKRNILALLGIVLLIILEVVFLFGFGGIFAFIGIALPLVISFAAGTFMACYAAYFKIKEIMIDPYYDENGQPLQQEEADEEDAGGELVDEATE